ncbi:MAG TPA: hypothetical protein VFR48_07395 [Solirubrobacteraceae bacterium]|nr:hypothetical protein [Solirubrobacteraceae bacterium]
MAKKLWLLLILLIASSGFAALSTASASALEFFETHTLANGKIITESLAATLTESLLFEDKAMGVSILCEMVLDGTVGAKSEGAFTAVLNLSGEEIEELHESGATKGLACTSLKGCEASSAQWWPIDELDLLIAWELIWGASMDEAVALVLQEFSKSPEWFVKCKVLGITVTDLCTYSASAWEHWSNVTEGADPVGPVEPLGSCTLGGSEAGVVEAETGSILLLTGGETFSIET